MDCPACRAPMEYFEGEDEFGTNELHWYAEWFCPACDYFIRDFEDEFEFPKEKGLEEKG